MVATLVVLWFAFDLAFVLAMVVRSDRPAIVAHHQRRDQVRALEYVWSLS